MLEKKLFYLSLFLFCVFLYVVPTEQVDSCKLNPQRKTWSQFKCGLLKSSEFAQCHSEVEVDSYYKRCVHGKLLFELMRFQ